MVTTLTLDELTRIKRWHVAHKAAHPIEYELLDIVLTLWLMGWVGWIPALLFQAVWAYPLCMLAMALPAAYVRLRTRAHESGHLRCDWIAA